MTNIAKLVVMLAFPIVGFYVAIWAVNRVMDSRFQKWQPLGSPPEQATQLLADSRFQNDEICVKTASGNIYCYNSSKEFANDHFWRAEHNSDWVFDTRELSPYPCHSQAPAPPKEAVDQVDNSFCLDFGGSQTSYALLNDGSVWKWKYTSDLGRVVLSAWAAMFGGPIIGLIAGWGMIKLIEKRWPFQFWQIVRPK